MSVYDPGSCGLVTPLKSQRSNFFALGMNSKQDLGSFKIRLTICHAYHCFDTVIGWAFRVCLGVET